MALQALERQIIFELQAESKKNDCFFYRNLEARIWTKRPFSNLQLPTFSLSTSDSTPRTSKPASSPAGVAELVNQFKTDG